MASGKDSRTKVVLARKIGKQGLGGTPDHFHSFYREDDHQACMNDDESKLTTNNKNIIPLNLLSRALGNRTSKNPAGVQIVHNNDAYFRINDQHNALRSEFQSNHYILVR